MAQFSMFWQTGSTGDGLNPYTQAQLFDWLRRTFLGDNEASQGVLVGYLGELAVTAAAGSVNVTSGGAYVYGIPYVNDTQVNIAIPTPTNNTRIDRIVLRADWAAQTVRITRIAGTEGAGAPAITQSAGSIWDLKLAQVSITTGGVITVTDERQFAHFATRVAAENIDDGAVTSSKIASGAVTTAKLADGSVTSAKIADGAALAEILDDDGPGSELDADLLDGQQGSFYRSRANHTGTQAPSTISPQGAGSGLNADMVDGSHASAFAPAAHDHSRIVNNARTLQIDSAGNVFVGGDVSTNAGGGTRVVYIPNAGVVPTGNPTLGGFLYVEDGQLKYRGPNGTVTPLAPA